MTELPDTGASPSRAPDFADYLAQDAARQRMAEELRPLNKAAMLDALAVAGIVSVTVVFDGCGDSGQIESIDARDVDRDVAVPEHQIELAFPTWDGADVARRMLSMREAIEEFSYALLEETHDAWEINEGAYGEFVFDVAGRAIRLDYNERIESSRYTGHAW